MFAQAIDGCTASFLVAMLIKKLLKWRQGFCKGTNLTLMQKKSILDHNLFDKSCRK